MGGQSLSGWPKLVMLTVVLSAVKQKKGAVASKFVNSKLPVQT